MLQQASRGPPEGAREQEASFVSPIPARTFQSTDTAFKGLVEPPVFDVAPVEPKVIAAKFHAPTSAPRRVTVERRRRAYEAYDIEQLLVERGINYKDPSFEAKSWLPLEPFDDTTFDDRSPQEWMALCKAPDGSFLPLPGKGLRRDGAGDCKWEACRVYAYDEVSNKFHVQFCDRKDNAELLRIELLFKSEDPVKFADRLQAAHKSRAAAESLIQYNYYIDNMPTSDIPGLDEVQKKRVMDKALSCPRTRRCKTATVDSLLKEVNTYFARTMNKIAFDIFLDRNKDKRLRTDLQLPPAPKPRPPSWHALVTVPTYDFSKAFASFCSTSLYVKTEVIRAMVGIREECVDVLEKRIFNTSFPRAVKLDEFRQMQRASISQVTYFLQEAWASKLHEIIDTNLRHVGKGWFNIYEFNKETYEYGKIKRMLILTRLLMRDALRVMATRSIEDLVELFRTSTPETVNIRSLSDVQNVYHESRVKSLERKLLWKGLFFVEVTRSPDGSQFVLTPQPEAFVDAADEFFDRGQVSNRHLEASKQNILRLIELHFPFLQKLIDHFQPFVDILCLCSADVVAETEQKASVGSVAETFRQAVLGYHERIRQIEEDIPASVVVGVFCVGCEDIKSSLKSTVRSVSQLLLDVLAKRFRDQCKQTLEEFKRITTTLRQQPTGIEELTELREFMDDTPTKLEALAVDIKAVLHIFDVLESFKYRLLVEDHNLRWKLYGSPAEILELSNEVASSLVKERARFLDDMLVQQCEFAATIADLADVVAGFANFTDMSKLAEVYDSVLAVGERIEMSIQQAKVFNHRERLFGRDVTDYTSLTKIQKVYGGIKALKRVEKILQERGLPEVFAKASQVTNELVEFKPLVPIIVSLRNDGMRERHWNKLFERIGEPHLDEGASLTLGALLNKGIAECTDFVVELGELATKESYLEKALQTMKAEWEHIKFEFPETYKDTDTYILKGTEEIVALLDEHIMTTQGLQFSIYKKPLEKEIDEWATLIMTASETLDEWLKCQRAWLYLQPIFHSPDIPKQLPAETKRFFTVDTAWRVLMRHTYEEPLVLTACTTPGLLDKLRENNRLLERVQKELQSYLELKRSQFARFYFLSNDELLEILSETTDPLKVQPFLCKVFENMNELEFSPDLVATAMFSAEGERMAFVKGLITAGRGVETWMQDLEQIMKLSVRESLHKAILDYPTSERTTWATKHAGQCVLNGSQAHWTALVEDAIQTGQLKSFMETQTQQLLDLVALVRKGLSPMQSITIGALIVIDVHAKDIVQRLWEEEVSSVEAFEWIAQLRYYWRDDNCWAQCVQTDFPYGYEYLGNTFRLVITPLTDMAYMTLLSAQQLNLVALTFQHVNTVLSTCGGGSAASGGSLAGPAGTGKTETTKDLAKALATQCVVFNCSEMMDFIMIAKFFKGLASSGAWCCFDEFNRINIEVLSVIAQQLVVLFGAKAQLQGYGMTLEIDFEDSRIVVEPTFNVFITMNPGYAGRTELPDNLKCLFRPMAMMVPDYSMIAEIMLYSFGFDQARELATKMVATFKLSSEQLSSQDHYDYGMRAVRSVINAAGVLKRKHCTMDEQMILLQALRDVNVPKFLSHDLPLFENIIADLFPGVEVPRADNQVLQEALLRQAEVLKLQPVEPFMRKVMQLYDTVQVRHGLMLVGPTGGGKTSSYRLLAAAMSELYKVQGFAKVHVNVLNPKSVTIGQLYGCFNETTHEWTDGLAAALIRHAIRDTSSDQHWIMFDGPVDALWIESMNSVLDDNKKLCLNSGEIISLTNRTVMMFEVSNELWVGVYKIYGTPEYQPHNHLPAASALLHRVEDLSVASPATVSRCGMVYMEPEVLGFSPLVVSWLKALPPTFKDAHKALIEKLASDIFPGGIAVLRKQCKEVVSTVNSNLCVSCLRMLGSICSRYRPVDKPADAEQGDALYGRLPAAFIFSFIWSFGITADGSGRKKIDDWLQSRVQELGLDIGHLDAGCSLYDFCYDINNHQWTPWGNTVPSFVVPKGASFDHKGWYDRKGLTFQEVVDVGMVAAMGPPGGGRNEISARLLRHYCVLAFDELQRASIATIFQTLNRHCFQQFPPDIQALTDPLVLATIDLYAEVTKTLLPTPMKSHYTFNMREVWKVFQGLAFLSPKVVKEPAAVIRCWIHETCRVFCDRLVDDDDRKWFYDLLQRQAKRTFDVEFADVKEMSSMIFADFVQQASNRYYLEVSSAEKLKQVVEDYMQDYNNTFAVPMQLVMFSDACAHVARICRVLRQPSGHALLLGVRGSGRQSLSRLAAFIMETECFQIDATKGYGMVEWREDLKKCFMKSGLEDKPQTFLFCDSQILGESMLEDINSALNYGDAPNIYKKEDMEEIMKVCRVYCKQLGVSPTKGNVFNAYVKKVKANLHIILAMSPLGIHFRTWLRMFPSLTNCCTINWFSEVEKTMIQIQQDHAVADETKKIVARDEAAASKKATETQALKDDAQRDLDEALPALEEAVECVKKLKSDHIREVKALSKPPSGVILTMEAVCIMFGVPPVKKPDPTRPGLKIEDYWESAQHKLLKDPKKLLEDLLKYDKDNIPESIIATISPYIERTDFDPTAIRKASVACEAICMWVRAMFKYYHVAKTVEPKRAKLQQAEAELLATTENLNKTKARLREVEDKIERLAADFALAVEKKEQLTKEIQSCQRKIQRAEPLLVGLADEKHRWGEQACLSKELRSYVSGHALISAGMLTYAGPFTAAYRGELETQWSELLRLHQLPFQPSCGLKQFLGDPVTIRQWTLWGLPNDELSIQNGIIMDRARRWPFMIDPQGQANRFIKRNGKASETGFEVLKLSDTTFMREIELSIQLGKWVLIENVSETLDPGLDPILLQQKTKSGSGLEDQMLGLVVTKEAPQLEERKAALAQSNADMRRELQDLQDKILQVMSQSQGNILDDEVLLNTLAASKQTSEEIQEKVQEAEVTEREIDEARQCYRKVAARCSQLFFCLVELACIEPMYQYSQQWFQNLVSIGISEAPTTPNIEQRTQLLVDHLSYLVYQNVSRSLFVRHKLLFAFALSLRVQAKTPVEPAELRFLLTGTVATSGNKQNPISWLTEKQWQAICELSHLQAFNGLDESLRQEEEGFRRVFDSLQADQEPLPGRWQSLNSIQKMCILRIIRMDSLTAAASSYVASELGVRFLDPPPFDLAQCYKDSTSQTPLIFILSQGSDPVSELHSFAKEMKMSRRFDSISLGQGQGPKAAKLIEEGCSRGGWVLLQNCHLASSWMNELERICEQWNPEEVHRDFRLWLTSMPSPSFPVSVLQNGVKMTNEPPKGLKANLQRLYAGIDNRQLNATQHPSHFKRLFFAFCFFHAVVQERRRFGPIGWNIHYEFTQDDLIVCQRQLRIFLDASDRIPFKVLRFLGARINYGGRVTDANDKRLIDFILHTYVNERLIEEGAAYKFSKSGIYYCPDEEDVEGFQKYIASLPANAQPEVFGLHENANINCAQMEGKELLDGILSMAPRSSSAGSTCRESAISDLAAHVQSLLPALFDVEAIQQKYPTRYDESMNTVVVQEAIRYNGLLAIMNKTMKDLQLAIKGRIVMTEELEKISAALFDNQVPKVWSDRGFVSMKPLGSWLKDLTARLAFLNGWIEQGPPKCYWMSGFFFPQAFLTGVLQNYARKYRVAVDRLSFAYTVLKVTDGSSVGEAPEDGCFVHGIFLEGCRWDADRGTLAPSRPKVLFDELPVVWFLPQRDRVHESRTVYMCPLYKVPSRKGTLSTTGHSTNYITSMELPCFDPPDVPIKAGVAALLALQD
ncbi:uncharacterized protein EMH_0001030 [Eimeria mitis]|uniref:Dynein heavy chain 1, axonemal, related n=1 Tax=Eimeria mitis TaxID=44415 RepID=U6KC90_9EIME|nr:uncharacterized protein EMH_0001030 [Eimeria mitis]CDJ34396.1 hypothetical protein EMH_0001030 [Eimeria mitis]